MDIGECLACEQCSKKCKIKGGLKLHHRKHSIDTIDNNNFMKDTVKEAIEKTCKKVLEEKLHPETVINEVEKYLDIITENDITDLQNKLLTLNFHEKELFYSKYYSQIVHRSKTYLKEFTENTSKVILMKLEDVLQAGRKETKDIDEIHTNNLNEKEVAAFQSLEGYTEN